MSDDGMKIGPHPAYDDGSNQGELPDVPPEITRLRRFDIYANHGDCNCEPEESPDGDWVAAADAEAAVRDAYERGLREGRAMVDGGALDRQARDIVEALTMMPAPVAPSIAAAMIESRFVKGDTE